MILKFLQTSTGTESLWAEATTETGQLKIFTKNGTFVAAERDGFLEIRAEHNGLQIQPQGSNKIIISETTQ